MPLFPKVRFKWREPKALVEVRDYHERRAFLWWHGILGVAGVAILMMPVWYLATLNPKKSPPNFGIALLLAIFLGVFLVYIVPWIIKFCPSEIRLTDNALVILRGNRHRAVKWKEIRSFTFANKDGSQVLRLNLYRGGELEIGLDPIAPSSEIQEFLQTVLPATPYGRRGGSTGQAPCASIINE
jgi:hypothetical protein